ncbi:FAD/NAD(P)-binding domain-containing protein [Lojkania enalia]|uniref:FAD/NAD(P)-binding domain-containing protein n=1 Tax=Lojkania enalia TaxID=147567 RepID=A0A9P4KHE8_9PLEO|nr:FAD/NAD(P)-binding domain-containing protein [Didymosphaeria enalia]
MSFISTHPKIIVVGADVGGLATALALHAAGFTDIQIYEASSNLIMLGVGINVQPSAVLILRNLGLLQALEAIAVKTSDLNYYNRHGNPIISEPRGLNAGYKVPQFSIHRGEFQMLLLSAVKERLGNGSIHLKHTLSSFQQPNDSSITASFSHKDSTEDPTTVTADILIAADGINSTARRILYPSEGPPRFSAACSGVDAGHADQKFIAYPISARSAANGKSMVNWIAELRVRSKDDPDMTPPESDWNKSVPKERFAGPFERWSCGGLDMADVIAQTDRVYEFPMSDRDPVPHWSFGKLTLLGDAAHAMYPIGSNGASQAIIDAECLAKCLTKSPEDLVSALVSYQEERLPATAKIVMANRANGPDHVLQLTEERAPDGFESVYNVIPKEELEGIGWAYKAVAGFEMEKVNAKADEIGGIAERLRLKSPADWV